MNTVTSRDIFSVYKNRVLLEANKEFNRQQFADKLNKKAEVFRDALLDVATRIDMSEEDQKEAIDEIFDAAQTNIVEYIQKHQSEMEQATIEGKYSTQGLVDDLNTAFGGFLGRVAYMQGPGQWRVDFPSSSKFYPPYNNPQQTAQQTSPAAPIPQQQPQPAQAFTPPAQNSTQQPLTPTRNVPTAVPLNPAQPLSTQQVNPFTGQPVVPGKNQQSQNSQGAGWNPFANSFKPGPGNSATYVPKSGPLAGTQQPVYPTRAQAYAQKEAGQSPLANTGSVLADFNRRRAYLSGRGY